LNSVDWTVIEEMDFDSKANYVIEMLEKKLNELVYIKEIDGTCNNYKKWYDSDLKKQRSERDFAHMKFYYLLYLLFYYIKLFVQWMLDFTLFPYSIITCL
jgi:hypothetical protein